MRHPLFVDPNTGAAGLPLNILQKDGEITVFDTSVDPTAVWAITMYVWWHTSTAVPQNPPALVGRVLNNGSVSAAGSPVVLPAAFFTALSAAQAPLFAPFKIIDKLCLRGSQVLTLQNSVVASENCFVWGYAERVGESVVGLPYRPLQPEGNNLVAPFVGDPQMVLVAVPAGNEKLVIHKLSNTYIDLLTLNVSVGAPAELGTSAKVTLPTGVEILVPFVEAAPQAPFYQIFDGIPMRAPSAADVDVSLDLTNAGIMQAYGHFLRA